MIRPKRSTKPCVASFVVFLPERTHTHTLSLSLPVSLHPRLPVVWALLWVLPIF
jgi:hypothetical protein